MRFIYEDSLPVDVVKGTLNLTSKTNIVNDALDSKNTLSLSNHELKAKGLAGLSSASFMPVSTICEGLNSLNPANLNFNISGTVEKPEFSGFLKSLTDLIKPNLKNVGQTIKNEVTKKGASGLLEAVSGKKESSQQSVPADTSKENSITQNAVNSLQSIFGKNK